MFFLVHNLFRSRPIVCNLCKPAQRSRVQSVLVSAIVLQQLLDPNTKAAGCGNVKDGSRLAGLSLTVDLRRIKDGRASSMKQRHDQDDDPVCNVKRGSGCNLPQRDILQPPHLMHRCTKSPQSTARFMTLCLNVRRVTTNFQAYGRHVCRCFNRLLVFNVDQSCIRRLSLSHHS